MLAESLALTPCLRSLAPPEAQLVAGLRLWVMMGKMGRCPLREVGDRLGSARAAAHLHLLLEEIGAAWPDPFCAAPPCCPRLSHDEALAVEMVRVAGRGDRPGFDRLLADLLPGHVRERLFLSASVLDGVLNA